MEPNTQQPTATPNKPVMDVVPPPKIPAADSAPADGMKTPPPMPEDAAQSNVAASKKEEAKKAPKAPKAPRTGVGLAVVATVIIMLGLAALFVYAYLRTNGVSVF